MLRPACKRSTAMSDEAGARLSFATRELLKQPFPARLGGSFRGSVGGELRPLADPASGGPFAHLIEADREAVEQAVLASGEVMKGAWCACTAAEREAYLNRFAELLASHGTALAELEALGVARPLASVRRQMAELLRWVCFIAGLPTKTQGHTGADPGIGEPFRCSFREPAGVALIRLNACMSLTERLQPVVAALAAGCAVVMLCDDGAYPGLYLVCELLSQAGIPEGTVTLLCAGEQAEAQLLDHESLFKPARIIRLGLMKASRMLVFDDADIDQVIDTLVERVLSAFNPSLYAPTLHLHEAIYDELLEALAGRLAYLRCGDALDPEVDVAPSMVAVLSQPAAEQLKRFKALGLRTLYEGERTGTGGGVPLTLLADDHCAAVTASEPLPAPVLLAQPFASEQRLLRRIGHLPQDEGVSLFTQRLDRIRHLSRRLHCEQLWVNSHFRAEPGTCADPLGPYLYRRSLWVDI